METVSRLLFVSWGEKEIIQGNCVTNGGEISVVQTYKLGELFFMLLRIRLFISDTSTVVSKCFKL